VAFGMYLFTAAGVKDRIRDIRVFGRNFDQKIDFPEAGQQSIFSFEGDGFFDLFLEFVWNKKFRISGLGFDDTLVLTHIPQWTVSGNVLHATQEINCKVECPDGRTSQNCITCRIDNLIVKICC
jgi:hypothetical protein